MKDAMAIRANASFSKENIISCIEANANTMRTMRYENKTNRLDSDSHNCCGYRSPSYRCKQMILKFYLIVKSW